MRDNAILGPWVRRFLLEHLVAERNLARNTQVSYRDSLTLLLPFVGRHAKRVEDISADRVRTFLEHLERDRGCTVLARNQRLAAVHSLARYIDTRSPEHAAWCAQVRSIPFKKAPKTVVGYLVQARGRSAAASAGPSNSTWCTRSRAHALPLQQRGPRR